MIRLDNLLRIFGCIAVDVAVSAAEVNQNGLR